MTTYELTKRMRRTLHFFWPRAESRIYDEAKRLVELGLADADRSFTGRRPRTTYSITPAGQGALGGGLGEPGPPRVSPRSGGGPRPSDGRPRPRGGRRQ